MKQVIEQLEEAKRFIHNMVVRCAYVYSEKENAVECINRAVSFLQAPCWETPEQYEKRTGRKWPDSGAVYANIMVHRKSKWAVLLYRIAKESYIPDDHIICANCDDPPPDDWKPEEKE